MKPSIGRSALAAILLAAVGSPPVLAAEPVFYGPTSYLSFADSPFNGSTFSYFHLENFEDSATPGYVPGLGLGSVHGPGDLVDSVELGTSGHSWYSTGPTSFFSFSFDKSVLGTLPTHAGIVWTDVGNVSTGLDPSEFPPGIVRGVSYVSFYAYGPTGDFLGDIFNAGPLGDGEVDGGKSEDRFFGVVNAAGISRIEIGIIGSTDWEVDHLQYGALNPVPEPEQWLMMALGLGAVAWRLKRSQAKG